MPNNIDESTLNYLCDDLGNETVAILIEAYCTEMTTLKEKIIKLEENPSPEELARICHTMKSASASFGATPLAEAAAELETHLIKKENPSPNEGIEKAKTLFPKIETAIKSLKNWTKTKA